MTVIRVDTAKKGEVISPLIFGHNIEHTRSCVWRGLSAEMLKNRKFAGNPERSGVARDWYAIGPESAWFMMEDNPKNTYVRHYEPEDARRWFELNAQIIECTTYGARTGIGQHGLALVKGKRYEVRLVLKSRVKLPVRVRFAGHDPRRTLFEKTLAVKPGAWRTFAFSYAPRASEDQGRMEITFDRPGRVTVGAASLLPAGHFHGMRRDVIERLKDIGATLLRWPGGNFAGDYRWLDGLLPVDQRGPLASFSETGTLPHTRGFDTHEIGTDEFISLCREVGAEPFITVNLAWDPVERAAAWVEYCNGPASSRWGRVRSQRGHREPYRVKCWSLGNELGYSHMEGPGAPSAYAKKAAAMARAMKRVDPSIVLCSSGKWDIDAWYPEALKPLSRVVDLFSHHHYTWINGTHTLLGAAGLREFRRIVGEPRGKILAELRAIRAKADRFSSRRVGISFDEWNVWYAWYRKPGVMDGVFAGAMLNMLCREAAGLGVRIVCLFEPINEGAIEVGAQDATLRPLGEALALFKPHHGRTALQLDAPAGDVDAAASVDERTGQVVVTLVNLNPARDQSVVLECAGGGAPKSAEVVVLAGKDFLPASRFSAKRTTARVSRDGRVTLRLPKLAVARVSLATGVRRR